MTDAVVAVSKFDDIFYSHIELPFILRHEERPPSVENSQSGY